MTISNTSFAVLTGCVLPLAPLLHADEILLRGDSGQRLSGQVTSIEESGAVEINSPLSVSPLRLKPDALTRIRLHDGKQEEDPPADTLLTLVNGDRLPLNVRSFEPDKGLTAAFAAFGDLTLPADALDTLEFGMTKRQLIYSGPGEVSDWSVLGNQRSGPNVEAEEGAWQVKGTADLERKIAFPRDFILSFRLKWAQNSQPNVRLFFASTTSGRVENADRYLMQFNSAGFEIKRESMAGPRYSPILVSNRTPNGFGRRSVDVEVHVSRATNTITLYLDGEKETVGLDPMKSPPGGDLLLLCFSGMDNSLQSIESLSVLELNNMRVRHRAEDRGDPALDGLISRDEDRWTGSLREIKRGQNGLRILFDTPLVKDRLELSSDDASTLFFRKTGKSSAPQDAKYRLQLRSEGRLSARSCRIADNRVLVNHPLLGELDIDKSQVLGIELISKESQASPKTEP